jgi:hypothetical protein
MFYLIGPVCNGGVGRCGSFDDPIFLGSLLSRLRRCCAQGSHDADVGEHGVAVAFDNEEQRLGCSLPFQPLLRRLRKLLNVMARITEGSQAPAVRENNRIVEGLLIER